jgi:hypothetical protein
MLLCVVVSLTGCVAPEPGTRRPHEKRPVALPKVFTRYEVCVKFLDALKVRATETGGLTSAAGADLSAVKAVAARYRLRFSQFIRLPDSKIESLESRVAQSSGVAPIDLRGMLGMDVSEKDDETVIAAGNALQALEEVEYVSVMPLDVPPPADCTDLTPTTLDYLAKQGYRGPPPGMDFDYAWSKGVTKGKGIRVADCEYSWIVDHEDICGRVSTEPGLALPTDPHYRHHGTAVVGILKGSDSATPFGILGLVHEADVIGYPEMSSSDPGRNKATCIASALADSAAGDIVLLEMQTEDPPGVPFSPVETALPIWDLIHDVASPLGIIVVAAAGNGTLDLDSAPFAGWKAKGDSGAILVGAGTSTGLHNRIATSNYGSRVDVQAWGENVWTTGFGFVVPAGVPCYPDYSGEKQWYTDQFDKTSAASAQVAAACAALQSQAVDRLCRRLTPAEMRMLLIDTGTPQGTGVPGHIGPFVNMRAAIDELWQRFPSDCQFKRGDCEGDNDFDKADVDVLMAHLFTGFPAGPPPCLKACDADDSGVLEVTDAVVLLNLLNSASPPPLPPCGKDTTNDDLGCSSYPHCP